jgi:TRAP-type C4-dicarboxylate transport system permease small subunit
MRKALNTLYRGTEALGAICLAMVGVMILSQIVGRQLGRQIPSADEMAGYFMAASGFLILGPALRNGVHIRVGLIIERVSGGPRRFMEILCLAIGLFFSGFLAWYWARLTWDSYDLGEMSQGLLAIPLWLPQGAMGFGLLVMVIAMTDELVRVIKGHEATYNTAGPAAEG